MMGLPPRPDDPTSINGDDATARPEVAPTFGRYIAHKLLLALLAMAASVVLAFLIYQRIGEWLFAHASDLRLTSSEFETVRSVFGPGHSTVHLFLRYVVATFEGGMGGTVYPQNRSVFLSSSWHSLVWFVPALLVSFVVGSAIGLLSTGRRKARNGAISTLLSALPFAVLPFAILIFCYDHARWVLTAFFRHPSVFSFLVVGIVMSGEFALAFRRAAGDRASATQEANPPRGAWRRTTIESLPQTLRCLPRAMGYAAVAVAATEWFRGQGLGSLWLESIESPSPGLAGVFLVFTVGAIITWLIVEIALYRSAPLVIARSLPSEVDGTRAWSSRPVLWLGAAMLCGLGFVGLAAPVVASGWDEIHPERSNEFNQPFGPSGLLSFGSAPGSFGVLRVDPLGRGVGSILIWELRDSMMVGLIAAGVATASGALLAKGTTSQRPRLVRSSEALGGYLLLLPSFVVVSAIMFTTDSASRAAWSTSLEGGVLLGLLMMAVPLRCIRRGRAAGSHSSVTGAVEGASLVFALAVSIWAVLAVDRIISPAHPFLGSLASSGALEASGWWLWVPEGLLLFVLILSARLIALGLGGTVSPWLPLSEVA